jgi:fumarylacetoacetase-like protein
MFHPVGHPMERGWVGRVDGDRVVHLAAQTLQSFFTGGGAAREHAEYPLEDVLLLPPVLHPPTVRVFDGPLRFEFANPAAVAGPAAEVSAPASRLALLPRLAAVVGAEGALGGVTAFADLRVPGEPPPKDRDFGFVLGPFVVTLDEARREPEVVVRVRGVERPHMRASFDWETARAHAERGTVLRPGDVLASPAAGAVVEVGTGDAVELEVEGIGVLPFSVAESV